MSRHIARGPGRPRETPACEAGLLLLKWASDELRAGRPGAITRLAEACDVDARTVQRWITGSREPRVTEAVRVREMAGVPVDAWGE